MKELAANPRRRVSTGRIARKFGFSEAHLAKVMQALGRADLVLSVRGPAGGFTLARPARDIALLAIVEAIEGPFNVTRCPFKLRSCRGAPCLLGRQMITERRRMRAFLASTRLESYTLPGSAGRRAGR